MKTKTYGTSENVLYFFPRIHSHFFFVHPANNHRLLSNNVKQKEFTCWGWHAKFDGCLGYKKERCNGDDADSPNRPFPNDGIYTWDTPHGEYSSIRYTEGHLDREWMEERDRNYILRLLRDGLLLELEPYANREIATDHRYRETITNALNSARAGTQTEIVFSCS